MPSAALLLSVRAQDGPIEIGLPPRSDPAQPTSLVPAKGNPIPGRTLGRTVVFRVRNETGNLTLNRFDGKFAKTRADCGDDERALPLNVGGKNVLRYHTAAADPLRRDGREAGSPGDGRRRIRLRRAEDADDRLPLLRIAADPPPSILLADRRVRIVN